MTVNSDPVRLALRGHDCPYPRYPAPVIPVCERPDGTLAAIYPGGASGPSPRPLDDDAEYERYDEGLATALAHFDWRSDRLFAFGPADVVPYPARREWRFVARFLRDARFAHADPFVRLMLTRRLGQHTLVRDAIEACYTELAGVDSDSAAAWRDRELANMPGEIFVAFPPTMIDSPITDVIMGQILDWPDLGSSFVLPEDAAAGEDAFSTDRIRSARVFIAIQGPESDAYGADPNQTFYQLGVAAGVGKPSLLVVPTGGIMPSVLCRDAVVIEYGAAIIGEPEEASRVRAEVARAVAQLSGRAAERKVEAAETGEQMRVLCNFASGVQAKGNVLMPVVRKAFQIACGLRAVSPGPDFQELWLEYEQLHANYMGQYLNGAASQASESIDRLLGIADGSRETFAALHSDFNNLHEQLTLYNGAYEAASRYVRDRQPEEPVLLTMIDPVEQTLQNVRNEAARMMQTLVTTVISTALPNTREDNA